MTQKMKTDGAPSVEAGESFRVLVVGGDHTNTLASVRALGLADIPFDLLLCDGPSARKPMLAASKYAPAPTYVEGTYGSIRDAISDWMGDSVPSSCILLPSSDLAALVIDECFRPLGVKSGGFIDNCRRVSDLMDKYAQGKWAAAHGIPIAKGVEVDLTSADESCPLNVPVIIKPAVSAEGQKSDIAICRSERDYRDARETYRRSGYRRALIQELVDYEYEITCIGTVFTDGSCVWRAYVKEAVYPVGCGSTALARLETDPQVLRVAEKVMRVLSDEGFRGPCDIDLFKISDCVLLNEINFRQSGIASFTFYEGLFLPALWTRDLMGEPVSNAGTEQKRGYHAMSEDLYLYYGKKTGAVIFGWLRYLLEPGGRTLRFPKDNGPFWAFLRNTLTNQVRKIKGKIRR